MIIKPHIFGCFCITAHPTGCFKHVEKQIDYIKAHGMFTGPKNVLIIGESTGYGLSARISATFGAQANTIGIIHECEAYRKNTASPSWYCTAAFEKIAHAHQYYAKTINGDAFLQSIKEKTARLIREDLQSVDLIIYNLAALPRSKASHIALKPIDKPFSTKFLDPFCKEVKEMTINPATEEEIEQTIKKIGGQDWEAWIDFLQNENLLSEGLITLAYDYAGPPILSPIYKDGVLGKAREHLWKSAMRINAKLTPLKGKALLSVQKTTLTQESAATPFISLYLALLFKIMNDKKINESDIQLINRLFKENLYSNKPILTDSEGLIRMDEFEIQPEIQQKINIAWQNVTTSTLDQYTDLQTYSNKFVHLFGFHVKGIDYDADLAPFVAIDSLKDTLYSAVTIKIVNDKKMLEDVFKLRYFIFKNVLKVNHVHLKHDLQQLEDNLDRRSIILGAYYENELVGTVRGTMYKDIPVDEISLNKIYHFFDYKNATPNNSAEISRYAMLKEYQISGASFQLLKEMLKIGIKTNKELRYVFLESFEQTLKYYEFFHFYQMADPLYYPQYKITMYPMCLDLHESYDFLSKILNMD